LTRGRTGTQAERARGSTRRRLAGACCALALGGLGVPALCLSASAGAASSSSPSQFLLKSGEQPGYTVGGRPTTSSTPASLIEGGQFTTRQAKSIVNTLKTAGFVKALEEHTTGSGGSEGFSLVMQFSNAAGAQTGAALFLHLAQSGQKGPKPFSVSGVTGAKGVTVNGSAGASANAYWSAGDCAFGSGLYNPRATTAKSAAAPIQAGIRSQAKRVGTTCP
jgi:hypothetical protein